MNTTPRTEEELKKMQLAPEADYAIEVLEASDEISKNTGHDMIRLKIGIYDTDAIRWRLFDYLLDSLPAKLRHACDTFGILDKYQAGTVSAKDFMGRTGHAKVVITEDKNGKYPPKNTIRDYICRAAKPIGKQPPGSGAMVNNEDLPF